MLQIIAREIVSQPLETNDISIFSLLSIDHGRYRTEIELIFFKIGMLSIEGKIPLREQFRW